LIEFLSFSDLLKDIVRDMKGVKSVLANHGLILEEIQQRLRNKGVILTHPEDMPHFPLKTTEEVDELEKSF